MVEENNGIFLAGGDVPVYLVEPMYKKYSTTFVWSRLFNPYVSYDQFFNSLHPVHTCTIPYVLNGMSISQPKNK